jgi:hypothetical protein
MPDARPRRHAVLVPRFGAGPDIPLLMYPGLAASRRGAAVRRISWEPPAELEHDLPRTGAWVEARVRPTVGHYIAGRTGAPPLLIGSSFGSRACSIAADYNLPGIWITPTLTGDRWVADALARSTEPFMLVGGTADPEWDGDLARSLTPHVVEIEGADHWLMVHGPLSESAAVLGHVSDRVEWFLDSVIWPRE